MKSHPGNRSRRSRFLPQITQLESRLTPSVTITSLGQDGHDLVGPNASPGTDGIQDLHLQLSGLSGPVSQITVTAPGGFQWQTAPDQIGAALAEYFPEATSGQGDLFINPQVQSDQPPRGGTLPLGGSTGSLIQLANGTTLSLSISYQGQSSPQSATVVVNNLISATDPMPAIPTPANVVGTFSVAVDGQDGTGVSYEQGYVHLVVTAPAGITFSASTFNQVFWGISDQAGIIWDSTVASEGHDHVYASLRAGSDNVVDLYFPPLRDEAPPSSSTAPTMLLQVSIPGDNSAYATPFMGAAWNLSEITVSPSAQSPPSPPSTEAALRADLMSTSPEYDTISLPANQTIVITQPLEITHSVKIIGNQATLLFQQGNTPAWPASASGAIYVSQNVYGNIQLELDNFTIKIDMSAPLRWSNPPGTVPALWDPENNPGGYVHAVIDTRDSNSNANDTMLTLSGMSIYGPPAIDGSAYSALQAQLAQSGDTTHEYVGEQDIDLLRANDQDFGTISGCTFQGGSIEVFGGPWTITNNTVLGSTAYTYSPSAFSLHAPHDCVLDGNRVSQSDPNGREFRLVNLAESGFNNTIENNSFGGGAGQIGDELSFSASSGGFTGINDPEVILAETGYGVLFEGRPGAISADGRLLVLPAVRAFAAPIATGPGMVVSILAGVGQNGAPVMNLAGEYFRVAQQVSIDANNDLEFLMQDPLPPMPAGGYYVIEVNNGFYNTNVIYNSLDLTGKSSTGVVFGGDDFGTQIIGNQFIGGTIYDNVYTGTSINLTAAIGSDGGGNGAFPLPWGWTALPDLGGVVEGNTIRDSLGGIILGVQHGVNYWAAQVGSSSETGRVYFTASVTQNTFEWDSSFLSTWSTASVGDGNNPAQSSVPPTLTIGSGFSAEAPGPYGAPRFPWTVGNAMTENGNDAPIFVDPVENVVSVEGNTTELVASNGSTTALSNLSGQVYVGIVNGVTEAAPIPAQTFNNEPYYPLNLDNLNIAGTTSDPPPPPPPPPVIPGPPVNVKAALVGANQIDLTWTVSRGATSYIVDCKVGGNAWQAIATNVTTPYYAAMGLGYSTTYAYRVIAVSSAGQSGPSSVAIAQTGPHPDVLAIQPLAISATRRRPYAGPVAIFTDANLTAVPGHFAATIRWGDGAVTRAAVIGGNGYYVVTGAHTYRFIGTYTVQISVSTIAPEPATALTSSIANVISPALARARARFQERIARQATKPK
jgi:hypothetical protein